VRGGRGAKEGKEEEKEKLFECMKIRGWERKPWGESSADTVGEWHRLSRAQILI